MGLQLALNHIVPSSRHLAREMHVIYLYINILLEIYI